MSLLSVLLMFSLAWSLSLNYWQYRIIKRQRERQLHLAEQIRALRETAEELRRAMGAAE
jgi:hypothetical protein